MKKIAIIGLMVVALMLVFVLPAQAEVLVNEKTPVTWTTTIPCSGETIVLEGFMHHKEAVTNDGAGGYHVTISDHPMGLQGVDTAGNKYNGVGGTRWTENVKVGEVYTYVNVYRMIGAGKAPNFSVHETYHYTINANGELTVDFVKAKTVCK
jgi:hypothetical protein